MRVQKVSFNNNQHNFADKSKSKPSFEANLLSIVDAPYAGFKWTDEAREKVGLKMIEKGMAEGKFILENIGIDYSSVDRNTNGLHTFILDLSTGTGHFLQNLYDIRTSRGEKMNFKEFFLFLMDFKRPNEDKLWIDIIPKEIGL